MTETQTVAAARPRAWGVTDLLMLAMVTIWGVNYSVIKIALQTLPPFAFNVLRFVLATAVMVAFLYSRGETLRISRRDIPAVIVLALAGHGFYQIFFISGLAQTSPANASLLLATVPIWVAIGGQIFGVERATRTIWAGIALSFVGIVILVLGGGKELSLGSSTLAGDAMSIFAAMLWAVYSTVSKPLLVRYSPVKVTTLEMVVGTPVLVAVGLPSLLAQDLRALPPSIWGAVIYSAVLSTAVAYVLWTVGVKRAGNARTAIYSNVTPVATVIAAWLMLGETLRPAQYVGAAVVLAGVMLTRRGRGGQ